MPKTPAKGQLDKKTPQNSPEPESGIFCYHIPTPCCVTYSTPPRLHWHKLHCRIAAGCTGERFSAGFSHIWQSASSLPHTRNTCKARTELGSALNRTACLPPAALISSVLVTISFPAAEDRCSGGHLQTGSCKCADVQRVQLTCF